MNIQEFEAELATMRRNALSCQDAVQHYWSTGSRASLEDIVQYARAASQAAEHLEAWHK